MPSATSRDWKDVQNCADAKSPAIAEIMTRAGWKTERPESISERSA